LLPLDRRRKKRLFNEAAENMANDRMALLYFWRVRTWDSKKIIAEIMHRATSVTGHANANDLALSSLFESMNDIGRSA
jgi:hypothetical protein